eukprot:3370775-Alexandrium_andersonii.AAC.1
MRCLRRVLGIPSTYGAKLTGQQAVTNLEVQARASYPTMTGIIRHLQLGYLGHVLRKGPGDPLFDVVFDRHLKPRALYGPRRPGLPRETWSEKLPIAISYLADTDEFNSAYAQTGREDKAVLLLAQDRPGWKRLI